MKKCIIWCRVSTFQQELERQKKELIEMAIKDGFEEKNQIIIGSAGASAIKLNDIYKNEVDKLFKTINTDKDVTTLYAWEISRLARNYLEFYKIYNLIEEKHLQLIIKTDNFRLLNADGSKNQGSEIIMNIMLTFAKQEMETKKERFKSGKMQKASMGIWVGGNLSYGYTINEKKHIVINKLEAENVRYIFQSYIAGKSQRELAAEFYKKGVSITLSLINRILHNERYTGKSFKFKYDELDKDNKLKFSNLERSYPKIISVEDFEKCQEISKKNNVKPKAKNIYYADGILICPSCGGRCSVQKTSYHCFNAHNKYMKYGIRADSVDKEEKLKNQCQNKLNLSVNVLDSLLWTEVKWREFNSLQRSNLEDIANYELEIEEEKKKIEVANEHLNEVKLKKKNLARVCLKTKLDDEVFNELLSEIEKEDKLNNDVINMSNARINQLEGFIKSINEKQQQAKIDGVIAMVNKYNDKDKQEACQRHIKSVSYFDDILEVKNKKYRCKRIEIIWNSKKPTGGIGFVTDFNDERERKKIEKISQLIGYQVFDSNDETLENEKSTYYYTPFNSNRIYWKFMVPSENGNLKEVIEEYEINIELRFKDKWKEKKKKERKDKILINSAISKGLEN
jgi:cassette chromosome recombinase B